jgi:hypothetical protein
MGPQGRVVMMMMMIVVMVMMMMTMFILYTRGVDKFFKTLAKLASSSVF